MRARRSTSKPLPHRSEATLPDGRTLEARMEFSVKGEGRFRFHYLFEPDGSLAAFGPVGRPAAQWRSFLPEAVTTIHRTITPTWAEKKDLQ